MSAPPLIVIFGAVVRPDGSPSASLLRRIGCGLEAALAHPEAPIFCSGGVSEPGTRSEAAIMAQALVANGIAAERLVLDEESLSTIDNAAAAARHSRAGGHPFVLACSDSYHLPRARLLLGLHGVKSRPWPSHEHAAFGHRLGMAVRECLAVPQNLARVVARCARRTS